MQFLVHYATKLLPENVMNATGEIIWQNILELQSELSLKRQQSVTLFATALTQLYPEQTPEIVSDNHSINNNNYYYYKIGK